MALMAVREYDTPIGAQADATSVNSVADMGRALFTRHTFAFEATSILILVAMVGAVVLARREGDQ
jgi:NADH-quinone oxidoreductase subunit J